MGAGHPGGPLSSGSPADSDWAAVIAFSPVTAGCERPTGASPAPLHARVWVFIWVYRPSWIHGMAGNSK